PVGSLETFDPATNTFALVGTFAARKGHAAALLKDGRVVIAGGFNGTGVFASMALFDPASNSITLLASSLSVPRPGLSATTLLDGTVLFFGGYDGTRTLNSADVFDPIAGTVTPVPAPA